jgi:outer membrane protein assembly factor BamB
MASSPLVIGDTVIVQLENQGESFAAGIDAATGETRWRIARGRDAIWSSPVVLRGKTPAEDIFMLHGRTRLSGHNPRTGATLWEHEGMMETVSSTTTCGNIIYLPAVGLHALQYDTAKRTVEPLWYEQRLRTGTSSPVVCGGRVYALNSSGVLTCGNAADGKTLWQERLKGPFWATPVMADGRLYCVNHDGLVQIVQPGDERRVVVTTQIDAGMLASPAVADGAIYFRSDGWLWKVAAGEGATR